MKKEIIDYIFNNFFEIYGYEKDQIHEFKQQFEADYERILSKIPEREIKILELRYLGKTYREIAEEFNISTPRIQQLYYRAYRRIHSIIKEERKLATQETLIIEKREPETIDDIELSVRAYNCLKRSGYFWLDDIKSLTKDDLLRIRNLGTLTLNEIVTKLSCFGIDIR